ncbi:hypothetical protein GE061_015566 [Apolygus lucorum]|uniref:Regulatory protein zeste n=1 Tax=Apolygus lucorum TaxID=248454 RepID=A0A8S9XQF5_APOLU|nr:hypothetical protein GE061_015566 [Apolygus lucorum]
MSKTSQKKVKAPNFSLQEEELLIMLVERKKGILECHKSDMVGAKDKKRAWEEVEAEFNANASTQARTSNSLREKYNNLKKKLRRDLTDEKRLIKGTGGGPLTQIIELQDSELKLLELMGKEKAVGRPSTYDSDSGNHLSDQLEATAPAANPSDMPEAPAADPSHQPEATASPAPVEADSEPNIQKDAPMLSDAWKKHFNYNNITSIAPTSNSAQPTVQKIVGCITTTEWIQIQEAKRKAKEQKEKEKEERKLAREQKAKDKQLKKRSVVQLKRLWENVKARRKAQLSAEKRERFKTGGGPSAQIADEDAELDSLGVDVEIVDAIDSDTGRLAPRSVEVVGMDEIQENIVMSHKKIFTEPEEFSRVLQELEEEEFFGGDGSDEESDHVEEEEFVPTEDEADDVTLEPEPSSPRDISMEEVEVPALSSSGNISMQEVSVPSPENSEIPPKVPRKLNVLLGKNGYAWHKEPPSAKGRPSKRNIVSGRLVANRMPRTYVRKTAPPSYTVDDVTHAVHDILNGNLTYLAAAEQYSVPKTVLFNRIKGRKTNIDKLGAGRPTDLPKEVEETLVQCLIARAKMGYPCDKKEVKELVQEYIKATGMSTRFVDGKPGEDWYQSFMGRNPKISLKKPEHLQKARKQARDRFVRFLLIIEVVV